MIIYLGIWAVGLASRKCDLNMVPCGKDEHSWVLRSDGSIAHGDVALDKIELDISEGDYVVSK